MNKAHYTSLFSLLLIMMLAFSVSGVLAQDDDHGGHDSAEDQCDTPDQEVHVVADPDDDGSNTYSVTTITATPGTCLMIEFENGSATDQHSFAIESDDTVMDHDVHLHVMNSSMEHKMINLQMPTSDVTIPFFCNVSDHKEDGMVGQIVVQAEDDSFLPGFGLVATLAAFTALLVAIPVIRKRN